jgi:hypothetical protein
MIISLPNDGRGYLYHVVDLYGQTVHAYRHVDASISAKEGDQRIFTQVEATGEWIAGGAPTPHSCLNLEG